MDELNKSISLDEKIGFKAIYIPRNRNANGREFTNPYSQNFFNLSGQLLTDYNACKTAYATYTANMTAYNNYIAAYNTWLAAYNAAGCNTTITAPTAPALQVKLTSTEATTVCGIAANNAADIANSNMNTAYNTALAAYNAKVSDCATRTAAKPTVVSMPSTFNPATYITVGTAASTPYAGFDGEPQYMNATGIDLSIGRKFQNAVGLDVSFGHQYRNACPACATAMFAAEGDNAEVTNTGWMKYAVIAVGTFFLIKMLKK